MLPMGTIVTVCMFLALLFATRLPGLRVLQKSPNWLRNFVGALVTLAGAWNTFWYALRHLTEFWGIAALISGLLLMITGVYIMKPSSLPERLRTAMPLVLLLLLVIASYYAWTIYQL